MIELRASSQTIALGTSGLAVSPIAWGMWRLAGATVAEARTRVDAALDAGITLFDTADIYGMGSPGGFGAAEALFGEVLAQAPHVRDALVLATKGGINPGIPYNSSMPYLNAAVEASLRRLRTEVIDLYQIHRRDFLTHPQEVAKALDDMVRTGKIRCVGVSNYSAQELEALQTFLSVPIVSTQPEFSALRSAPLYDGTLDQAMARNIAVLAWSPLGGGRLADADGTVAALLHNQGALYGVDHVAAALSWLMVHPARVIPIIGSQSPQRIAQSQDAMKVGWTRAQWYAVLEASTGAKLP